MKKFLSLFLILGVVHATAPTAPTADSAVVTVNPSTGAVTAPATFFSANANNFKAAVRTGGSFTSVSISGAGNTSVGSNCIVTAALVTVNAGSAPYTATISLMGTPVQGDLIEIYLSLPASTNPTIQVYENGTSGTLLSTVTSTGTAGGTTLSYFYDGSHWQTFRKGALLAFNNLADLPSAATARINLGLGTAATQASTAFDAAGAASAAQSASLQKTSNLSDLSSASTARTNLGLGSAATLSIGSGWSTPLSSTLGTGWSTALGSSFTAGTSLSGITGLVYASSGTPSAATTTQAQTAVAGGAFGTGVAAAHTNAVNGASGLVVADSTTAIPGTVPATSLRAPAGSIVIVIGDSTAAGVPYVTGTPQSAGTGTDGYSNTGQSWTQIASGLPFWKGVTFYNFGVAGTRADQGVTLMGGGTATGTKYLNGAVSGSFGGQSTTISALASTVTTPGAKIYFIAQYGINDVGAGFSASAYSANMKSIWASAHALGSNVVVVGYTVPAGGSGNPSPTVFGPGGYNDLNWRAYPSPSATTGQYWDTMADIGGLFYEEGSLLTAAGYLNTDNIHPVTLGYTAYAQEFTRAVIAGASHQQSIIPLRYIYSNDTGGRMIDLTGAWVGYNGSAYLNCAGTTIGSYGHGNNIDFGNGKLYASGGFTSVDYFGQKLVSGGATYLDWSNAYDVRLYNTPFSVDTAGKGYQTKEGSNCKQGTATLASGTVTVSNTAVTASSRIFLTTQSSSGTVGTPYVSARTAGTSFTISSTSGSDNSVVAYEIFEPAP